MIIGKNPFPRNKNFENLKVEKNKKIKNDKKVTSRIPNKSIPPTKNVFIKDMEAYQHTNILNKEEMNEKSFAMLNDRLSKGVITQEEFNKQCKKIAKRKND